MEARAEILDESTYAASEDESSKEAPYDEPKRVPVASDSNASAYASHFSHV